MAEELSSGTISPDKPDIIPNCEPTIPQTQGDAGRYSIQIVDYSPAGAKEKFSVALPDNDKWGSIMLRAAILKRTSWRNFEIPTVIHAVVYADQMGLDIMAGDVYMAEEGRLSTTAAAKIRHAMGTGRIRGYSVDIKEGPEITLDYTIKNQSAKWTGPNLSATVTVEVDGWTNPVIYKTSLAEWFVGRNPNWRTRPAYMLRRNALSKALEEVAPLGIEADEAPPVERPFSDSLPSVPQAYPAEQRQRVGSLAYALATSVGQKAAKGGSK